MEHFIYALTDPNGNPFYIGKSINPEKRKKRHVYDATTLGYNYPVHNKIRKLLRQGLDLGIEILEGDISDCDIDGREQFWISDYRQKGIKIYNVANGGEGGKGSTPETIEKVRQAHLGKRLSDETKKKISESNKGKIFSDEHRKLLSEARRQRKTTNETRTRMSESSKGKVNIKTFKLTDPSGQVCYTTNGLSDFCRQHQLDPANLSKVLKGERDNHKGWRIERVDH